MIQPDAVLRGSRAPSHFICQDYVSITETDDLRMVSISDGCSSAEHTDIGSRLILRNLYQLVKDHWPKLSEEELVNAALKNSVKNCVSLGISTEALDATVGLAYHYNGELHASLYGDGFIISIGDLITVIEVEFPQGYPYYPILELSSRNLEKWKSIPDNGSIVKRMTISDTGEITSQTETPYGPGAVQYTMDPSVRCVMVSSDGLRSFVRSNDSGAQVAIPINEVIPHIVKIPRWNGNFIQRRVQRFTDFCDKQGWRNLDDVSIGAIYAAPD